MNTSIIQNYTEKLYPQKRGTFWGKIGYLLGQNRVPFGASRFYNILVYRYLCGNFPLIIILIRDLIISNYYRNSNPKCGVGWLFLLCSPYFAGEGQRNKTTEKKGVLQRLRNR